VLQSADVAAVFLLLGLVALVGAATMALFGVETRGAVLEKLSPEEKPRQPDGMLRLFFRPVAGLRAKVVLAVFRLSQEESDGI
jgi:hypothetical protein